MNVSIILILLLIGSFSTYFLGNKLAKKTALFFSISSVIASFYILKQHYLGVNTDLILNWITNPNLFFALRIDGLSIVMVLLTTVLSGLIILSSFGNKYNNSKTFYSLVLFMSFAMVGTFLSADAFLYYIFWELSLLPIYFIALIWGNDSVENRKKAIIKFFIYTLAGSLFMLVSFMYLFQKAGSLMIGDLYAIKLTEQEQLWVFLGLFMAYAVKIPIFPFHTWQASMYQKSPAVGTMLLAGIMLKMGLYSIIRWQLPIAPIAARTYMYVFISLGILGVIYGSIIALKQRNIKKLLAYSSLAHVGLIAAGIYTLTLDGIRGAVLQMIAHGVVVVGLFFAVEVIERRFNTQEISKMGGIRLQDSRFASMFLIIMLASIALPGTFNFISEFTILYSLFSVNIWLGVLAGTTVIFGAVYMLKMFQDVMLGDTNTSNFKKITFSEGIVFIILIVLLLFFGLYPKPILDLVSPPLIDIVRRISIY